MYKLGDTEDEKKTVRRAEDIVDRALNKSGLSNMKPMCHCYRWRRTKFCLCGNEEGLINRMAIESLRKRTVFAVFRTLVRAKCQ